MKLRSPFLQFFQLSKPLPRKGTETPYAGLSMCQHYHLSKPLPRKGTETFRAALAGAGAVLEAFKTSSP